MERAGGDDPVLDALDHGWGAAYEFDRDADGRWARRRDGLGGKIRGGDPDAPAHEVPPDDLLLAVAKDYQFHPVPPRPAPPPAGGDVSGSFTTAGLGVVPGTGGAVDQVVRKTAWEQAHAGARITQDGLIWVARHAGGELAGSAHGDLGALMGKLDQAEAAGRCPVHSPPAGDEP